jgi:hypothetical protein
VANRGSSLALSTRAFAVDIGSRSGRYAQSVAALQPCFRPLSDSPSSVALESTLHALRPRVYYRSLPCTFAAGIWSTWLSKSLRARSSLYCSGYGRAKQAVRHFSERGCTVLSELEEGRTRGGVPRHFSRTVLLNIWHHVRRAAIVSIPQ